MSTFTTTLPISATTFLGAALLAVALTAGCGEKKQGATSTAPSGAGAPALALETVVVQEENVPDAVPVGTAKPAVKQGDTVTVLGRIGGSVNPFNRNRAVFTIVDPKIPTCGEGHDPDHCSTPWDYCCEPPESLRANVATIEIAGPDGKPLTFSVQGMRGLEPMATITVTGTVVEHNDQGVFLVRAEKIHVNP